MHMLVACGIRLQRGYTERSALDAAMSECSRMDLEHKPYRGLLAALGTEHDPIAENLWHFELHRIASPESYVQLVERIRDMTDGALPLEGVASSIEGEVATISFTLENERHEIAATVRGELVDLVVIRRLGELLAVRHPSTRLYFIELDGAPLLASLNAEGRSRLSREANLDLDWVDVLE